MNAVNPVQLFILVWTFTAVCQAGDGDISVSCEDVTGTVREEVTLTCSVFLSLKCTKRCIMKYKFQDPENHNDSEICRQEFLVGSCEQKNSFTCRFTPNTTMTRQLRFFVQTLCGIKTTEFSVNITEPIKPETDTEDPDKKDSKTAQQVKKAETVAVPESKVTVIAAVVGCFIIIIILIIITLTIIYKTESNYQPQWIPVCLGRRHDEDNSNCPETVI